MEKVRFHKNQIIADCKLLNLLSVSKNCEVWEAISEQNKVVAIKLFAITKNIIEKSRYEYDMAMNFKHTNIILPIKYLCIENQQPAIVFSFCQGRSVECAAGYINEQMVWKLISEISSALMAVHKKGYIHYDVKPSNILWNEHNFLLSDFGACRNSNDKTLITEDEDSYQFNAPELLTKPCKESDIWSLGATIFYLYMGCHVFNGLGGAFQHKDSPLPYMRKSLPVLSELVQQCLSYETKARPTIEEIQNISKDELKNIENKKITRETKNHNITNNEENNLSFWHYDMTE